MKLLLVFIFSFCVCSSYSQYDERAIALHNKAMNIYMKDVKHFSKTETLALVDSALKIDENYTALYQTKAHFLLLDKKIQEALDVLEKSTSIKKETNTILMKGFIYERVFKEKKIAYKFYTEAYLHNLGLMEKIKDESKINQLKLENAYILLYLNKHKEACTLFKEFSKTLSADVKQAFITFNKKEFLKSLW